MCCSRWSSTGNINQELRSTLRNMRPTTVVSQARGPAPTNAVVGRALPADQLFQRRPLPIEAVPSPSSPSSSSSSRANAGRSLSFDGSNTIGYSSEPTIIFGPHLPPPSSPAPVNIR